MRGSADTNLVVPVLCRTILSRPVLPWICWLRAVVTDRPAVKCGLCLLAAGGDFADALIAFSARRLGGEPCVSFERRAVQLLAELDEPADLLQA